METIEYDESKENEEVVEQEKAEETEEEQDDPEKETEEERDDSEKESEEESDEDELLPSFVIGETVYESEQLKEMIENQESDRYKALAKMTEDEFDSTTKQFDYYQKGQRLEASANKIMNKAKEVSASYEDALSIVDESIDKATMDGLKEDYPDIAENLSKIIASHQVREKQINEEYESISQLRVHTMFDLVAEKVTEFKGMDSSQIIEAMNDEGHDRYMDAILLKQVAEKAKNPRDVVDKLNKHFERFRVKAKQDTDTKLREDLKKKSTFGFVGTKKTAKNKNKKQNVPTTNESGVQHLVFDGEL